MSKSWRGPSQEWRNRISSWEGSSMYKPAPDTGRVNNSFENEAQGFINSLPISVRGALSDEALNALYSYSYNVGVGNFRKRVLPTLQAYVSGKASAQDVASHMYGTNDSKYKGLQNRRSYEKEAFLRGVGSNVSNQSYNDYTKYKYTPTASPFTSTLGKLSAFSPKNSDGYTLPKVGNDANSYWYSYTAMPELKETREDLPTAVEYTPMFSTNTEVNTGSDYLNTIYKEQLEKMQDNVNQDLNAYVQQQDTLDRLNAQMASLGTPSQGNNIFAYGGEMEYNNEMNYGNEMDYRGEEDKLPVLRNLSQAISDAYAPVEESDKSKAMLDIAKNISAIVKNEYNPEVLQPKESQKTDDIPVSVSETVKKRNKVTKPTVVNTPKPTKLIVGTRANTLSPEEANKYEKTLGAPIERADDGSVQAVMSDNGEILGTAPALQLHEAVPTVMNRKDFKALVEAASKDDSAATRLNVYLAEHAGNIPDEDLAPDGILGSHGITREKLNTLQMYYDDPYLRHSASGNFYFNPNAGTLRSIMRSERLAERGLLQSLRGIIGVSTGGWSELGLGVLSGLTHLGHGAFLDNLNSTLDVSDPVGATAEGIYNALPEFDKDNYLGNAVAAGLSGAAYMKGPWWMRAAVGGGSALASLGSQYATRQLSSPHWGNFINSVTPALASALALGLKIRRSPVLNTANSGRITMNTIGGAVVPAIEDFALRETVAETSKWLFGLDDLQAQSLANAASGSFGTAIGARRARKARKAGQEAEVENQGLATEAERQPTFLTKRLRDVMNYSGGYSDPITAFANYRQNMAAESPTSPKIPMMYTGTSYDSSNPHKNTNNPRLDYTKRGVSFGASEGTIYTDSKGNQVRVAGRQELNDQAKQINSTSSSLSFKETTIPIWDYQSGLISLHEGQTIQYGDATISQHTLTPQDPHYNPNKPKENTVLLIHPTTLKVRSEELVGGVLGKNTQIQDTANTLTSLSKRGYTETSSKVEGIQNVDRLLSKGVTEDGVQVDSNLKGAIRTYRTYKHPTDPSKDVITISMVDYTNPGSVREHYTGGVSTINVNQINVTLGVSNRGDFQNQYLTGADSYSSEQVLNIQKQIQEDLDKRLTQYERDRSTSTDTNERSFEERAQDFIMARIENYATPSDAPRKAVKEAASSGFNIKVEKGRNYSKKEVQKMLDDYAVKVQNAVAKSVGRTPAAIQKGQAFARKKMVSIGNRVVTDLGTISYTREELQSKLPELRKCLQDVEKGKNTEKGSASKNKYSYNKLPQDRLQALYKEQQQGRADYGLSIDPKTGNIVSWDDATFTMYPKEAADFGVNAEFNQTYTDNSNYLNALIHFAEKGQ